MLKIHSCCHLPGVDDAFTYRATVGTHQAPGLAQLRPGRPPGFPPSTITPIPFPPSHPSLSDYSGLTLAFGVPAAGTYVLERKTVAAPGGVEGVWTEVSRQLASDPPTFITFVDALLPGGALYRVRSVP